MLKYLGFLIVLAGYVEATHIPLHEEDPHFIQYKVIQIDNSLNRIEKYLKNSKMSPKRKDKIYIEIDLIRYNLGLSDGLLHMIQLGD